jgi:transcriptional regulator with XRE-family HTH domain
MDEYNYDQMIDRIKIAMKNENLSIKKLANLANVPYGTLYKVFSGETKEPSINLIIRTASVLNVTANSLIFGEIQNSKTSNILSEDERELLEKYRKFDSYDKKILHNLIDGILDLISYRENKSNSEYDNIYTIKAARGTRADAQNIHINNKDIEEDFNKPMSTGLDD